MKKYEKYKPTGIQWLPEIPDHWHIKYLFQVSNEHYISNKDRHHQNLLSLSYGKIVHKDINTTEGLLPASFDTYQIIEPGNIVFRFTDLQNDHKSLRVGLSKETGIITSAYIAVEVDTDYVLPEYFYYTLHSFDIKKLFYSMGSGLRQSLNYNGIRKLRLPIPPIDEQIKTIAYLDERITLIENCKCQRERELQTLNELKQAEIASVVTRGLNPNVPMVYMDTPLKTKHPSHWKRVRNMTFLIEQTEKVGKQADDYQLLSLTTNGIIVRDVESGKGKFPKDFESYKVVEPGELVFCLFDIDETPRTIGLSQNHGMITGAYDVFKVKEDIVNPSFVYAFYLVIDNIKALKPYYSGLRKVVKHNRFMQIGFALPPIEEQNAIVEYIESKTNKIDTMIEALKAEIDRLTEYKQRLISDVVTGQIDIRGEQI